MNTEKQQINIITLLCDSITSTKNREVFKYIDELYNLNKFEFYKLAQNSEEYNSVTIKDADIMKEEYNKKLLGVLLHIQKYNNPDYINQINEIIKIAYPYMYNYFSQHRTIDLKKYTMALIKKMRGLENITDDELNANLILLYVLAQWHDKEIIRDETLNLLEQTMIQRLEHGSGKWKYKINYDNVTKDELNEIEKLKSIIFKDGKIINRNAILKFAKESEYPDLFGFLFDIENITTSMFDYIEFTNRDIQEMLYLLNIIRKNNPDNIISSEDMILNNYIILMFFRYMLKTHKNMKEYYFENHKETMFFDLEFVQKQLNVANSEMKSYTNKIEELQDEIKHKDREIKRLRNIINDNKLYKGELIGLRNLFFDMEINGVENRVEVDFSSLVNKKYFILGGHETLQNKLKEYLKSSIFIGAGSLNFDSALTSSAEKIIIFPLCLNHAIYYKVVEQCRKLDKEIIYINNSNVDLILNKLL